MAAGVVAPLAPPGPDAPPAPWAVAAYVRLVRRRSGWILAAAAAATLGFGTTLPRLDISNPPEKYQLPPDDPVALETARFRAVFGGGNAILVALEYAGPIGPAEVREAWRLAAGLRELPGIGSVRAPLGHADPLAVSAEGRALLLAIETASDAATPALLRTFLATTGGGYAAFHLAGLAVINEAFEAHLARDLRSFVLLGLAVSVLLLLALYRTVGVVLASAGVAAAALVWSLGVVSLARTPLAIGLAMMIPLLLMLGVAYSAHYICHWLDAAGDRDTALAGMLAAVLPPSVVTGAATAAGFLALNTSGIEGLRDVGTHFGIGALATALLTATVIPALLYRYVPPGRAAPGNARSAAAPAQRAGSRERGPASSGPAAAAERALRRLVLRHSGAIIAASAGLALVSAAGLRHVQVDANHLAYLDPGTAVRQEIAFVDVHFGGLVPVEVLVPAAAGEAAEALAHAAAFADRLRRVEGIGRVLPPLARAVAGDSVLLRVGAAAYIGGTVELGRVLAEVRGLATEAFGDAATLAGMMPVFVRTLDFIVRSQVASFAVAFGVVALLFLALAGTARTGAFAVVANVLPILAVLGLMGWTGVPLDFGTVMIASVLIGIAVHDTVHVLYRLRREQASGAPTPAALAATFMAVGRPVVISTIVFCGGLLVLTLSDFGPVRTFGLLASAAMVAALAADLLLLPALVARGGPRP
jgi:uncharacterized protein